MISKKPPHVLLLIGQLSTGGSERQFVNLAKAINPDKFVVHAGVLSTLLDFAPELESAGIPLTVMPKHWRYDLSIIPRLVRFILKNQISLVHTVLFGANVVGALAATLARVPVVISERSAPPVLPWKKRVAYRPIGRLSAAVVVNAHAAKTVLATQGGIHPGKIFVHYNGIDLHGFEPRPADRDCLRRRYGIPEHGVVVGTVGRLIPVKNTELLLRTAARMKRSGGQGAHFIIVGDVGPGEDLSYREHLFSLEKSLGLEDTVTFVGMQSNIAEILALFDVFAFTSLWEGTPNALLEAMAAGVPVVATDVGDVRAIVADAGSGIIADGDPEAFSKGIAQMLSNKQSREEMGAAGSRYVRTNFTMERLVRETETLWQAVLEGKVNYD